MDEQRALNVSRGHIICRSCQRRQAPRQGPRGAFGNKPVCSVAYKG